MTATPPVTIIAAVSRNNVIGAAGAIPWRSKADMRHFSDTTMGHCVVMGRKTHASIGRPLAGRMNVVVSRTDKLALPGCEVRSSLAAALTAARERPCARIFVIGGAQIYRQSLARADHLVLSRMELEVQGDTLFPEFAMDEWHLAGCVAHDGEKPAFRIEHWQRTAR